MDLKMWLRQLQKDNVLSVKVGSNDGVSYFYADYLSKDTYKEIAHISNLYLAQLKRELTTKIEFMLHFDEYWENRFAEVNKIKDKKYRETLIKGLAKKKQIEKKKQLDVKLKELPKVIAKMEKERDKQKVAIPRRIKQLDKEIINFVAFLDREVVEVFDGILTDEPNNKNVKIKGTERGKYWFVKEYRDDKEEKLKAKLMRQEKKEYRKRRAKWN